jgi:hypothetical protein
VDGSAFAAAARPVDTHGYQPAARPNTVGAVIDEFLDAARGGQIVHVNGHPYEDEQIRDMRWSLRGYVASELGEMGIGALNAAELRAFIDRLDANGLSQARTRAVVKALRALLRYAAERGMVAWSVPDTLVFGDADERPEPRFAVPPPSPAAATPEPPVATAPVPVQAPVSTGIPDDVIWLILKIVTLVFALIALVLVAESV